MSCINKCKIEWNLALEFSKCPPQVKMSCNATELLVDEITVAGTSTVLEGLPQGVWCTVSVAAVTSDGVEAWSEPKPVLLPSGSSENSGTGKLKG